MIAFDYNNDGKIDIFQANDGAPNFLFRNNGDGTFSEVALEADCALRSKWCRPRRHGCGRR